MTSAPPPDVTVVIGVYNAMPYLIECVNSVLAQTIRRDRLEIVAVDDGSTDGSGELVDRYADLDKRIRVVHQANSGTPSGPRNVGIEMATGRYLFFLDSDDYLGVEALERLVAVADKNGSDMVIGRIVGINRPEAPVALYTHNQPKADLYNSKVYTTLRSQRLFSRSLIDRVGLRFPELLMAQDIAFSAVASIHAKVISVVADYDCYYLRLRDDGQNITRRVKDILLHVAESEHIMSLVGDHVPAGPQRDFLMRRHFTDLVKWCYTRQYVNSPAAVQLEAVERSKALLTRYYTPAVAAALPARDRLRLELVDRGSHEELAEVIRCDVRGPCPPELIEQGRIFVRYPGFRDPQAGLPDALFDVTADVKVRHSLARVSWDGSRLSLGGHAFIEHVDMGSPADRPATEVVLRRRGDEREVCLPVTTMATPDLTAPVAGGRHDYGLAGFALDLDISGLLRSGRVDPGLWDVFLGVQAQGVRRVIRFGRQRAAGVDAGALTAVVRGAESPVAVRPYFTKPWGNLTLDVGADAETWRPGLTVNQVAWARSLPATLVVAGRLDLTRLATRLKPTVSLVLTSAQPRLGDATWTAAIGTAAIGTAATGTAAIGTLDRRSGQFVVVAPLARAGTGGRPLRDGRYTVALVLDVDGVRCEWPVPTAKLATVRWWRRGWPAYAAAAPGPSLTVDVSDLTLRRLARGLGRRLAR